MWALLERESGRNTFLYSARTSIDSLWKVGVKRGWWKGVRNGDVWLFVGCLMVVNGVFTRDKRALRGGVAERGVTFLRGMDDTSMAVNESATEPKDQDESKEN